MRATIDKIPLFLCSSSCKFHQSPYYNNYKVQYYDIPMSGLDKNIKRLVASYPWLHNLYAF